MWRHGGKSYQLYIIRSVHYQSTVTTAWRSWLRYVFCNASVTHVVCIFLYVRYVDLGYIHICTFWHAILKLVVFCTSLLFSIVFSHSDYRLFTLNCSRIFSFIFYYDLDNSTRFYEIISIDVKYFVVLKMFRLAMVFHDKNNTKCIMNKLL